MPFSFSLQRNGTKPELLTRPSLDGRRPKSHEITRWDSVDLLSSFSFLDSDHIYHKCIDIPTPTPVVHSDGNSTRFGSGCWCGLIPNVNTDLNAWAFCPCSVTVRKGLWSQWVSKLFR